MTAAQGPSSSRFRVEPDPPVAGSPAEVTYIGPATQIEWQVDGGQPRSAKPDADGKVHIPAMPKGTSLYLSDNLGLPGYLQRNIIDLGNGGKGKGR